MAGRRRREALLRQAEELKRTRQSSRRRWLVLGGIFAVALFASMACVIHARSHPEKTATVVEKAAIRPTLDDLLKMAPEELARVDIATMNLLCASGLPGAEDMDIDDCLATLDRFAAAVKFETERCLAMYIRNPAKFRNIEGFYRMQMLVTVIKKDLGVDYSPNRTNDEPMEIFFANSKDLFLNGLLAPLHTGTCASLPVLMVAVGRKLGYPLHLVPTRGHLFARWESADGKERFNIESTNGGMGSHPDEHYTKGQYAWEPEKFGSEGFLQNLTPEQELANFLDLRGLCLRMSKRFSEAHKVYEICTRIRPESKIYAAKLKGTLKEEQTGQLMTKR